MMKINYFIALVICSLVFASCTAIHDQPGGKLPETAIPVEDMNVAFVIEDLPVLENSRVNGERLALVLRNNSDKVIVFPPDYNLEILANQNQDWDEVQNLFRYTGTENLLPAFDVFPPGRVVIAYPYIPGLSEPTLIRIVMTGHYENSDSDVGAYIDITLIP